MKVVEKKCPNCGSSIEIEEGERIFKCKYCGTTLERDKNEELQEQVQNTALNFFKYTFAYMGIMQIIFTIFFVLIFLFIVGIAIFGFAHA